MHPKSEIIIDYQADEVKKKLFDSLKSRYQTNSLSIKGSEFVFDYVNLLYYKCHKVIPNHGGSYIDCPNWTKAKKQQ